MPTKRVPIERAPVQLTPTQWRWLMDEPEPPEPEGEPAELFFMDLRELWLEHRAMVLPLWSRERPGTRPSHWWQWDAPLLVDALPGTIVRINPDGTPLTEPRRRLGGTGTPSHECLAYWPHFALGIPVHWLSADLREYLRLAAPAYDPTDPPTYEAQATYLERHGLLLRDERRRLRAPDFEPERVELAEA